MIHATLIFLLLPQFGPFEGYDIQPTYFIPLLLSWLRSNRVSVSSLALGLLCTIPVVVLTVTNADPYLERGLVYVLGIITTIFMYDLRRELLASLSERLISKVLALYLLVALGQVFFGADLFSGLVGRSAEQAILAAESGRGVRSLTGEPSHFGMMLIQLYLLRVLIVERDRVNDDFPHPRLRSEISGRLGAWELVVFMGILLLSQSSYATAIFAVILFLRVGLSLNFKSLMMLLLISVTSVVVFFYGGLDRWQTVITILFTAPEQLLQQGAIVRLLNPALSSWGIVDCFPYPMSVCVSSGLNTAIEVGGVSYLVDGRVQGGILEVALLSGAAGMPVLITFLALFVVLLKRKNLPGTLGCVLLIQSGAPFNPALLLLIMIAIALPRTKPPPLVEPRLNALEKCQ